MKCSPHLWPHLSISFSVCSLQVRDQPPGLLHHDVTRLFPTLELGSRVRCGAEPVTGDHYGLVEETTHRDGEQQQQRRSGAGAAAQQHQKEAAGWRQEATHGHCSLLPRCSSAEPPPHLHWAKFTGRKNSLQSSMTYSVQHITFNPNFRNGSMWVNRDVVM